jgi:hypothetical protein
MEQLEEKVLIFAAPYHNPTPFLYLALMRLELLFILPPKPPEMNFPTRI